VAIRRVSFPGKEETGTDQHLRHPSRLRRMSATYALNRDEDDHRRLVDLADLFGPAVRAALERVGVGPGHRTLDCGCGPTGALRVMSDLVGAEGHVTGLEVDPATVQQARSIMDGLGLSNVDVVLGDVHDTDAADIGGPVDVAYTRYFVIHQRDLVRTLGAIARLVRPGGHIVIHEPLHTAPPRSHPHHDAIDEYWKMLSAVLAEAGSSYDAAGDIPAAARQAGLDVTRVDGFFTLLPVDRGFEMYAATLAAVRPRAIQAGIATGEDLDKVVDDLREARTGAYEWITSNFFLDVTLQVPG
jgi:SAM-dependent methyltransferase